jgi:pimeloyl-ACP methyl ester carboxylesterase
MTPSEHTLNINGLPVHYWEDGAGNGRVILLLHGNLGDAQVSWGAVLPLLADEYRLIAPDLPGFGKSAVLPNMSVTSILAWIKAFLDELKIEQGVVMGNSLGAVFARLFAATYPQYAPAVILVNGGTLPRIPPVLHLLARLPVVGTLLFGLTARSGTSLQTLRRMVHVKEALSESLVKSAANNAPNFARLMQTIAAHPLPEKRTPQVPVLLLWGENDQISTLAEAKRIQNAIPGATLVQIESCGHLPQLEAPEVFVWQIKQYLHELTRPPRMQGAGMLPQRKV